MCGEAVVRRLTCIFVRFPAIKSVELAHLDLLQNRRVVIEAASMKPFMADSRIHGCCIY